jgi:hypothetical protein
MVDTARAYRRWLRRRLFIVAPAFLAALALSLTLVLDGQAASWLRVPSGAIASALAGFLAYLGAQAARAILHAQAGRRRSARTLRRELRPYRALTLGALALLLTVVSLPLLFREPVPVSLTARVRRLSPPARPVQVRETPVPTSSAPIPAPQAREPVRVPEERGPAPEASAPEIKPVLELAPPALVFDDQDPGERAVARVLPGAAPEAPPNGYEELHGAPRFRGGWDDLFRSGRAELLPLVLERYGLVDERDPLDAPPPEIRVDLMMDASGGHWEGTAGETAIDLPLGRADVLRVVAFLGHLTGNDDLTGAETPFSWQRLSVEYVRRLAGYTRHASFDLAVSLGACADYFDSPVAGSRINAGTAISSCVGIDAALWYAGTYGFVVHAGQSIPLGITPLLTNVTDLSAALRVDLTESLSLHAGWRIVWFTIHDRTEASGPPDTRGWLAGPVVGLNLRF